MTSRTSIDSKTLLFVQLSVICGFAAAQSFILIALHGYGHDYIYGFAPLFDLDTERNIPTTYSTTIFFVNSAFLWFIGRQTEKHRWQWYLLAIVFVFLGLDEACGFHEQFAQMRLAADPSVLPNFAWAVPYSIGAAVVGLFFLPFLFSLPRRTRILMMTSGIVFVSGAAGFEALSWTQATTGSLLYYDILSTLEELLELLGIALFLYALAEYLELTAGGAYFGTKGSGNEPVNSR